MAQGKKITEKKEKEILAPPIGGAVSTDCKSRRLVYAGPALPLFGLSHGQVYIGGIPSTAPTELEFAFVPIGDLVATRSDPAFIRKCKEAIRKSRGGK